MVEDLFLDNPEDENGGNADENESGEENGGTNRTGNYSVMMRLNSNIPQMLPMAGRRVKIIVLRHPVTILVTVLTETDNLINDLPILKLMIINNIIMVKNLIDIIAQQLW